MTTTTKASAVIDDAVDSATSRTSTDELAQRAREAASTAAGTVTTAAEDIKNRIPGAASEVDRVVRSSSDDALRLATVATVGVAAGLLIGGANRILVIAALAPAAFMGMILSGRRSV
jgi:hypothetical protein